MSEQAAPRWSSWAMRRALAAGVPIQQPTWGVGDAFRTLGLALAATVALYFALSTNRIDPANGWGLILTSLTTWAVMALWPLRVSARKGNGAVLDYGLQVSPRHVRLAVIFFAFGMGAASVAAWVITRVRGEFTSAAGQAASNQRGLVLILFAMSTVLVAPVCEELVFRGLLYTALVKRGMSDVAAVGTSAVIFAVFHFEPTRFLLLVVLGVALGEVRRRTGSTSAAMITHALVNLLPAVAMLH